MDINNNITLSLSLVCTSGLSEGTSKNDGTWMCLSAPILAYCLGDVPAHAEAVLYGHARE